MRDILSCLWHLCLLFSLLVLARRLFSSTISTMLPCLSLLVTPNLFNCDFAQLFPLGLSIIIFGRDLSKVTELVATENLEVKSWLVIHGRGFIWSDVNKNCIVLKLRPFKLGFSPLIFLHLTHVSGMQPWITKLMWGRYLTMTSLTSFLRKEHSNPLHHFCYRNQTSLSGL